MSQPFNEIRFWLEKQNHQGQSLFTFHDLKAICPSLSQGAFRVVLGRLVKGGVLERLCRGLYLYKRNDTPDGLLLYRAANTLRANEFNYLSLETVLVEAGIISQITMNWITVMTSGRSNTISCGQYGTIEFIHTQKQSADIMDHLIYDNKRGMWKADIPLALRDMKATHRNLDLINWEIVNELI